MSDAPGNYSEALAGLHEAFKDRPDQAAALTLALGSLVDRIRSLEEKVQAQKDEATRREFFGGI